MEIEMILRLVILFGLGSIVGSFINAQALRYGTSRFFTKRSKCFKCSSRLHARDLIPIFSWLFSRGRCRHCQGRISPRYLLVELNAAILFVVAGLVSASIGELIFLLLVNCLLLAIFLVDLDTMTIPHPLSWGLNLWIFISLFIFWPTQTPMLPSLTTLFSGVALAAFFWFLHFVTKGRGMGFADGTISLGLGWLVGYPAVVSVGIFSFWIGAVVSVGVLALQNLQARRTQVLVTGKKLTLKSAIPFGPFLIMSALFVFYTGIYLW